MMGGIKQPATMPILFVIDLIFDAGSHVLDVEKSSRGKSRVRSRFLASTLEETKTVQPAKQRQL